ncbi:MAG: hypothetical protein H7246_03730 [Phycisphaerae bacterium]|nr:hypothetical protein [Saprospiraceae bacterium]
MNLLHWLFPFGTVSADEGRFTTLRAEAILKTTHKLEQRIAERFPDSGLLGVCKEFHQLAIRSQELAHRLQRPIWPVRMAAIMAATFLIGIVIWAFSQLVQHFHFDKSGIFSLLQTTESAINELIFLGLALFSLLGLEMRLKRHSALKALHRLRSIAHVVDMHQLTKDPAFLLSKHKIAATESSPQRTLTRQEIMRYLDYCSEMLALNAKIAALFAQNTDDSVILSGVNDLELLVQGLSAKIWQKIMILDLSAE